jgi:uncharacterized membrane protein YraQ (UPF0718 family)
MLKDAFGPTFLLFGALAVGVGTAVYLVAGWGAMMDSMSSDLPLVLRVIPNIGASVLIAAFLHELMPANILSRHVGEDSGVRGVAVASAAGALTPGGPMTSFAFVTALRGGGTGSGQLVAYVTAWSTMGIQRIIAWELPLMGPEFTLLRIVSSLPLPFIAGFIAPRLPAAPPETRQPEQP